MALLQWLLVYWFFPFSAKQGANYREPLHSPA
jgi:hypothetical protein